MALHETCLTALRPAGILSVCGVPLCPGDSAGLPVTKLQDLAPAAANVDRPPESVDVRQPVNPFAYALSVHARRCLSECGVASTAIGKLRRGRE